jgi:hypothetical protein
VNAPCRAHKTNERLAEALALEMESADPKEDSRGYRFLRSSPFWQSTQSTA